MDTAKARHLPVVLLIELMEQSDHPEQYEDMILWRAGELEDPRAIDWVCSQVKGEG